LLERIIGSSKSLIDWSLARDWSNDCSDKRKKGATQLTDLARDREELRQHRRNIVIYYCKEEKGIATEKKSNPRE